MTPDDPRPRIKIVQTPLGEAPEWVREAWIGVTIPLVVAEARGYQGFGVLTGPKSWFACWWRLITRQTEPVEGYLVSAAEAVELLAFSRPQAAQRWRQNAPHLLGPKAHFVFDTAACKRT